MTGIERSLMQGRIRSFYPNPQKRGFGSLYLKVVLLPLELCGGVDLAGAHLLDGHLDVVHPLHHLGVPANSLICMLLFVCKSCTVRSSFLSSNLLTPFYLQIFKLLPVCKNFSSFLPANILALSCLQIF